MASTVKLALDEAQRCLNCDVQTVFTVAALHRVRRLRRHLPDGLHHLHRERRGSRPAARGCKAPVAATSTQDLYVADGLKTGRVMVKDEDVCLHCGLCAERCPTGAWDMQKYLIDMTHAEHHASPKPDQQRKRLRRPVRQRQRLGLGERQRAVRPLDPAHGRAGRRRATSSRPTSRACRPGTRCASPRTAISAPAAAST